jgi:hypothetical protein
MKPAYRFWGMVLVYIGAGILLGALLFYLQQSHDGLLAASPTPSAVVQDAASPAVSPTATVLNQAQ